MSVQGQLRGQCWSQLTSMDTDPGHVASNSGHAASVRISPVPVPSDDVMKLPREDMTTFGRCPAWDNFVLVTCEKCDKIVKIEAFESHVTLRHGSKSERSAYHRDLAAKAAASLQLCEVKLTPCSTAPTSSNSSVAGGQTPGIGEAELPSSSCTTPQPMTSSRSPSPVEAMDTEPPPSTSLGHKYMGEEADSTTNNVISIPDTDDMANIEIISEGQSLLDSMDSKFSFSQNQASSADSTSFSPKPVISIQPPSLSRSGSGVEAIEAVEPSSSPVQQPPTHYITVSPLASKSLSSPNKKVAVGRMVQPHVAHPHPPSSEKKSSRDREYDPNKHCGVLDPETKKPCTRSLTCKSHSVYLKRKVSDRSREFDELLANHKAEKELLANQKEAAAAKQLQHASSEDAGSSILERVLKRTPPVGGQTGVTVTTVSSPGQTRLGQIQVVTPPASYIKPQPKDLYCEDSLHYTTDHPKPLSVCTFGGRRLGGLFIADRSKLLTRKVMKLALSNSGIRSVPIVRQQTMPYIVNFQGAGSTISSISGISTISGIPARIGTIKLASGGVNNIQSIQPQQILVQDPFKSDMGDFKGGLKFELSRNINQMIPSGSESAG